MEIYEKIYKTLHSLWRSYSGFCFMPVDDYSFEVTIFYDVYTSDPKRKFFI